MLHTIISLLDKYQLLGSFQLCLFLKSFLYNKRGLTMLFLKENCATGSQKCKEELHSRRNEGFWHNSESSKNGCWDERIPQSDSISEWESHGKIRGQCPEQEASPSVCSIGSVQEEGCCVARISPCSE